MRNLDNLLLAFHRHFSFRSLTIFRKLCKLTFQAVAGKTRCIASIIRLLHVFIEVSHKQIGVLPRRQFLVPLL